jgi:transposase
MSRPPELFVRPVSMTEGQRLQRIGRTAKDPVKLRRAIVVLMSAQGQSAPDIAHLLDCSQEYVRQVIHDFNDIGFRALDPKWSGGRPKTISEQARRQIRVIARCCPRDLGLPFSAWSLSKLAEHLAAAGVVTSISRETIRQILRPASRPATTMTRRWPSPANSACPWRKHAPWKASATPTSKKATPPKPPPRYGMPSRSTSASEAPPLGASRKPCASTGSPSLSTPVCSRRVSRHSRTVLASPER